MLKFIFLGVDGQSLRLRGVLPSIDGYLKKIQVEIVFLFRRSQEIF